MTVAEELIQQGMERGRQEGIQKGMQQGIQKGLQQGLQKGLQKLHKAIHLALQIKFGKDRQTEELFLLVRQINDMELLDLVQEKILGAGSIEELKDFVTRIA